MNFQPDKMDLAREALHAANQARLDLDLGLDAPVCCFDICHRLGVKVRFVDVSMEGFYQPGDPARIHLSALRPLQRRHFTCAHELGHHLFGHGVSLDELRNESCQSSARPPRELLADMFAGHLLLPAMGLKKAFNDRKVTFEKADHITIHEVASDFGVGYETLLTHLAYALKYISPDSCDRLSAARGQLRDTISDEIYGKGTKLVGNASSTSVMTLEIGQSLIAPIGSSCMGDMLVTLRDTPLGSAFRASAVGQTEIFLPGETPPITVRTMPYQFVGLAEYRFLEGNNG